MRRDFRSPNQAIHGRVMFACVLKYFRVTLFVSCSLLLAIGASAGKPSPEPLGQTATPSTLSAYVPGDIDVYVKGPNAAPLEGTAVVTLTRLNGEFYDQKTAKNGYVRFNDVPPTEYKIQVVAPKYEGTTKQLEVSARSLAKITIELTPLSAEDAASSVGIYALAPKTQREVGKALEELRANKPGDARKHLEAAQKNRSDKRGD